jgi:two-component system nitrate/nitrite response regulator NarL
MARLEATARSVPSTTLAPTVVVVADSALLAEALAVALSASGLSARALPRFQDRGPATSPPGPAVVIDGPKAAEAIRYLSVHGHAVVAIWTDPDRHAGLLEAGATAAAPPETTLNDLTDLVDALARDEPPPPSVPVRTPLQTVTEAMLIRERLATLTRREQQILSALIDGLRPAAIARRFFVSLHTVRTHIRSLLGKLEVHSQLEAVAAARRAGWDPDST